MNDSQYSITPIIAPVLLVAMLFPAVTFSDSSNLVEFSVDVSHIPGYQDADFNVGLRGGTPPLSWATSNAVLSDPDRDGVYTTRVNFGATDHNKLEFKYVLDGGLIWESGENRVRPLNAENHDRVQHTFRYQVRQGNPFSRFFGEWKFKDDAFSMVWDGKNVVTQYHPEQVTQCKEINNDRSMLCVINEHTDESRNRGHIFWTFDSTTQTVHWLSSFFPERIGVGEGTFDNQGNLTFKVRFSSEGLDTHRKYEWTWKNNNEYTMLSSQYKDNRYTNNWYGGTFIKLPTRK